MVYPFLLKRYKYLHIVWYIRLNFDIVDRHFLVMNMMNTRKCGMFAKTAMIHMNVSSYTTLNNEKNSSGVIHQ